LPNEPRLLASRQSRGPAGGGGESPAPTRAQGLPCAKRPGHIAVWPDQRRERAAAEPGRGLPSLAVSGRARQRAAGPVVEVSGVSRAFGQGRAAARALAADPDLLIADEPTGQLDTDTGRQIIKLIQAVVRSAGITALVATHDPGLIGVADQVLRLEDGRLTPA